MIQLDKAIASHRARTRTYDFHGCAAPFSCTSSCSNWCRKTVSPSSSVLLWDRQ